MNIYYVTRWGNGTSGPDEEDTSFVVLAKSYSSAVNIVDESLLKTPSKLVDNFCHRVTELGSTPASSEMIIIGPVIENALYHDDVGIPDKNKWVRGSLEDGWEKFSDFYED